MALGILLSVALQYCTFNLAVTKKTVGDGAKLLTYLNSVLKVLLGTDSFHRVPPKKLNFVVQ
jgi:predicted membrane channel-forming protein YqfA (hemolysin III family)